MREANGIDLTDTIVIDASAGSKGIITGNDVVISNFTRTPTTIKNEDTGESLDFTLAGAFKVFNFFDEDEPVYIEYNGQSLLNASDINDGDFAVAVTIGHFSGVLDLDANQVEQLEGDGQLLLPIEEYLI